MPRKVLYLADYYVHPRGGTEGQLLQLIEHLQRDRFEPTLAVLRNSDYLRENAFPCPVQIIDVPKVASLRGLMRLLAAGWQWRKAGYSLVHCFFNDSSVVAPPLTWLFRMPVIVSRRDMGFWYTPGLLMLLRLIRPLVTKYIANSAAVKRVTQDKEGAPAQSIRVIYNGYVPGTDTPGVQIATQAPLLQIRDATREIGIVANLRQIKRIDVLIKALPIVMQKVPDVRLTIVGGDSLDEGRSMLSLLQELTASLDLQDRVTFVGSVITPMDYIRRFAVAVLCSESEGFSNAIMQYMEAGRPIVCTDTGGNSELIQHDRTGLLVPVGNIDALAEAVTSLLMDSKRAATLGANAAQTLATSYSVERMVAEHMDCYDEVLGIPAQPKSA